MREDPEEWKHKLGSEALTEIWQMGYRDLMDLQHPFEYVHFFVALQFIKFENL